MVTEAIINWLVGIISVIVNPIIQAVFLGRGVDIAVSKFYVPTPLFDYVSYVTQSTTLVMPFALVYWTWRQIKS